MLPTHHTLHTRYLLIACYQWLITCYLYLARVNITSCVCRRLSLLGRDRSSGSGTPKAVTSRFSWLGAGGRRGGAREGEGEGKHSTREHGGDASQGCGLPREGGEGGGRQAGREEGKVDHNVAMPEGAGGLLGAYLFGGGRSGGRRGREKRGDDGASRVERR